MNPFPKTRSFIASILLVTFTVTNVSYAAEPFDKLRVKDSENKSFAIPSHLGTLEKFSPCPEPAEGCPTLFFIQDAHDSLEAQENISKIIHHLVKHEGVKTVFEEGYEGPVPTDSLFGFIKDAKIREKISYFLLNKLRLGAAEYAHINRVDGQDFELFGADNLKLYKENIAAYRKAAKRRGKILRELNALHDEIKILVHHFFPKEFKDWMKLKERYDSGKFPPLDYLKRMVSIAQSAERMAQGKISTMSDSYALSAMRSANNSFDLKMFLDKIDFLENKIAHTFLKNARDVQVFKYHKNLSALKRLAEIKLTPQEFEQISTTLSETQTGKIANFIVRESKKSVALSKTWETDIQNAIRFYKIAHQRDEAIEKTISLVPRSSSPAILIFGGFHRQNIESILQRNRFSYYVISPRITKPDPEHQSYYQHLMTAGHHAFEKPFLAAHATRSAALVTEPYARAEIRALYNMAVNSPNVLALHFDRLLLDESTAKPTEQKRAEVRSSKKNKKQNGKTANKHFRHRNSNKKIETKPTGKEWWRFRLNSFLPPFLLTIQAFIAFFAPFSLSILLIQLKETYSSTLIWANTFALYGLSGLFLLHAGGVLIQRALRSHDATSKRWFSGPLEAVIGSTLLIGTIFWGRSMALIAEALEILGHFKLTRQEFKTRFQTLRSWSAMFGFGALTITATNVSGHFIFHVESLHNTMLHLSAMFWGFSAIAGLFHAYFDFTAKEFLTEGPQPAEELFLKQPAFLQNQPELSPHEKSLLTPRFQGAFPALEYLQQENARRLAQNLPLLKTFKVFRHVRARHNLLGLTHGSDTVSPITLSGLAQKKELFRFFDRSIRDIFKAEDLNAKNFFQKIFSSRSERTFRAVQNFGDPEFLSFLGEVPLFPAGGIKHSYAEDALGGMYQKFSADPETFSIPNVFEGRVLKENIENWKHDIENDSSTNRILAGIHGLVSVYLTLKLLGVDPHHFAEANIFLGRAPTGSISTFAYDPINKKWQLLVWGDASYLPEKLRDNYTPGYRPKKLIRNFLYFLALMLWRPVERFLIRTPFGAFLDRPYKQELTDYGSSSEILWGLLIVPSSIVLKAKFALAMLKKSASELSDLELYQNLNLLWLYETRTRKGRLRAHRKHFKSDSELREIFSAMVQNRYGFPTQHHLRFFVRKLIHKEIKKHNHATSESATREALQVLWPLLQSNSTLQTDSPPRAEMRDLSGQLQTGRLPLAHEKILRDAKMAIDRAAQILSEAKLEKRTGPWRNRFMLEIDAASNHLIRFLHSPHYQKVDIKTQLEVTRLNDRLGQLNQDFQKFSSLNFNPTERAEMRHQSILTPVGLLTHGTRRENYAEIRLHGLQPASVTKKNARGYYPNKVSLALSPDEALRSSAFSSYGPDIKYFPLNIIFIIDPHYVKTHPQEFTLVGREFSKDPENRIFREPIYQKGLKHLGLDQHVTENHGMAHQDEIQTSHLPAEAILGIVSTPKNIPWILTQNENHNLRTLPIYLKDSFAERLVAWEENAELRIPSNDFSQVPLITPAESQQIIDLASDLTTYDNPENQELYRYVATLLRLGGVVVDIAQGGNFEPARGLLKAGVRKVYGVDGREIDFPTDLRTDAYEIKNVQAQDLPWTESSLDAVIFNGSLHYLLLYADPSFANTVTDKALLEAWRVLKPGGWLLAKPGNYQSDVPNTVPDSREFDTNYFESFFKDVQAQNVQVFKNDQKIPVFLMAQKPFKRQQDAMFDLLRLLNRNLWVIQGWFSPDGVHSAFYTEQTDLKFKDGQPDIKALLKMSYSEFNQAKQKVENMIADRIKLGKMHDMRTHHSQDEKRMYDLAKDLGLAIPRAEMRQKTQPGTVAYVRALEILNPERLEDYRILRAIAEVLQPELIYPLSFFENLPLPDLSNTLEKNLDDFAEKNIAVDPEYDSARKEKTLSQAAVLFYYLNSLESGQAIKDLLLFLLTSPYAEDYIQAIQGWDATEQYLIWNETNKRLSLGRTHQRLISNLLATAREALRSRKPSQIEDITLPALKRVARLGFHKEADTLLKEIAPYFPTQELRSKLARSEMREEIPALNESSVFKNIEQIFANPDASEKELAKALRAIPYIDWAWMQPSVLKPNKTIFLGEHTETVLRLFDQYLKNKRLPGDFSPGMFRFMLAVHDLAKPEALAAGQDPIKVTLSKIREIFSGNLSWDLEPIIALIENDAVGLFFQPGKISLENAIEQIKESAQHAGLDLETYFKLKSLYHQLDILSYSDLGSGIYRTHFGFKMSSEKPLFSPERNRFLFSDFFEQFQMQLEAAIDRQRQENNEEARTRSESRAKNGSLEDAWTNHYRASLKHGLHERAWELVRLPLEDVLKEKQKTDEVIPILEIGGGSLEQAYALRDFLPTKQFPIMVVDVANIPANGNTAKAIHYIQAPAETFELPPGTPKAKLVFGVRSLEYTSIFHVLQRLKEVTADDAEFIFLLNHPLSPSVLKTQMDFMYWEAFIFSREQGIRYLKKEISSKELREQTFLKIQAVENAFQHQTVMNRYGFKKIFADTVSQNQSRLFSLLKKWSRIKKTGDPVQIEKQIAFMEREIKRLNRKYESYKAQYDPLLELKQRYQNDSWAEGDMEEFLETWGIMPSGYMAQNTLSRFILKNGYTVKAEYTVSPTPENKYLFFHFKKSVPRSEIRDDDDPDEIFKETLSLKLSELDNSLDGNRIRIASLPLEHQQLLNNRIYGLLENGKHLAGENDFRAVQKNIALMSTLLPKVKYFELARKHLEEISLLIKGHLSRSEVRSLEDVDAHRSKMLEQLIMTKKSIRFKPLGEEAAPFVYSFENAIFELINGGKLNFNMAILLNLDYDSAETTQIPMPDGRPMTFVRIPFYGTGENGLIVFKWTQPRMESWNFVGYSRYSYQKPKDQQGNLKDYVTIGIDIFPQFRRTVASATIFETLLNISNEKFSPQKFIVDGKSQIFETVVGDPVVNAAFYLKRGFYPIEKKDRADQYWQRLRESSYLLDPLDVSRLKTKSNLWTLPMTIPPRSLMKIARKPSRRISLEELTQILAPQYQNFVQVTSREVAGHRKNPGAEGYTILISNTKIAFHVDAIPHNINDGKLMVLRKFLDRRGQTSVQPFNVAGKEAVAVQKVLLALREASTNNRSEARQHQKMSVAIEKSFKLNTRALTPPAIAYVDLFGELVEAGIRFDKSKVFEDASRVQVKNQQLIYQRSPLSPETFVLGFDLLIKTKPIPFEPNKEIRQIRPIEINNPQERERWQKNPAFHGFAQDDDYPVLLDLEISGHDILENIDAVYLGGTRLDQQFLKIEILEKPQGSDTLRPLSVKDLLFHSPPSSPVITLAKNDYFHIGKEPIRRFITAQDKERLFLRMSYVPDPRSEMRTTPQNPALSSKLETLEEHVQRLASDKKVVSVPYLAKAHEITHDQTRDVLKKYGFVFGENSEQGEQWILSDYFSLVPGMNPGEVIWHTATLSEVSGALPTSLSEELHLFIFQEDGASVLRLLKGGRDPKQLAWVRLIYTESLNQISIEPSTLDGSLKSESEMAPYLSFMAPLFALWIDQYLVPYAQQHNVGSLRIMRGSLTTSDLQRLQFKEGKHHIWIRDLKTTSSDRSEPGILKSIDSSLSKSASEAATLFIPYEEIKNRSELRKSVFGLAYEVEKDKNTKLVIYGVPNVLEESLVPLRKTGVEIIEGGLGEAWKLFGQKENPSRNVHFSFNAERLKQNLGEPILAFLAQKPVDVYAALLFARSDAHLFGIQRQQRIYSVIGEMLDSVLLKHQNDLVVAIAA